MRQRNVKNKEIIINNSRYIVFSPTDYIGCWHKIFNNDNPIFVEIGMGKGNFILENAKRYPNINFIGIERYDSIIALALKKIEKEDIKNLRVIRMDANIIEKVFHKEVDKIFLNFSDPWPKKRHINRRLTSEVFLEKYNNIFKNDKVIEMKTDNHSLFEYSLITLSKFGYFLDDVSLDLHHSDYEENIMTEYEEKFSKMNNLIYYVRAIKK